MNHRCPDTDCAGSQTLLPEAMANAMGMKCPVCGITLVRDEGESVSEPFVVSGGKWEQWPTPVAIPLREYEEEQNSVAKLWAVCDMVEMLLRLLVIALVGERSGKEGLESKVRERLARLIESPTLGAWFVMAQDLGRQKDGIDELKAAKDFIGGPLRELLYGPDNPGTDETSFIKLRNRLAHGGGMTRKESDRLLNLWRERVEELLEQLSWIEDWSLLGRNEAGKWIGIKGVGKAMPEEAPEGLKEAEPDAVWLRVKEVTLPLWPLAAFVSPQHRVKAKSVLHQRSIRRFM